MARNWTQEELTIALGLYCKLPFGQFHQHQPLIKLVAELLDRTPSSLAMKLCNLAGLDPVITEHSSEWMPEIEQRLSQLLDGGKSATMAAQLRTATISTLASLIKTKGATKINQRGAHLFPATQSPKPKRWEPYA